MNLKQSVIAAAVILLCMFTYYKTQIDTYPNCLLEAANMPTKMGVNVARYACKSKYGIGR